MTENHQINYQGYATYDDIQQLNEQIQQLQEYSNQHSYNIQQLQNQVVTLSRQVNNTRRGHPRNNYVNRSRNNNHLRYNSSNKPNIPFVNRGGFGNGSVSSQEGGGERNNQRHRESFDRKKSRGTHKSRSRSKTRRNKSRSPPRSRRRSPSRSPSKSHRQKSHRKSRSKSPPKQHIVTPRESFEPPAQKNSKQVVIDDKNHQGYKSTDQTEQVEVGDNLYAKNDGKEKKIVITTPKRKVIQQQEKQGTQISEKTKKAKTCDVLGLVYDDTDETLIEDGQTSNQM